MTNRIASLGMKAIFGIVLLLLFPAVQPAFAALAFIQYLVPTPNSTPVGITAGPDGSLWFTELDGNNIGRITINGAIIEYSVPKANSKPIEITSGPDGNLWFTEESGNNIGRITTTGAITEYAVPTPNSDPEFITAGPDGNLWFTEDNINVNNIGRITTTGAMIEYPVPTPNPGLSGITAGPDGNLWFTENAANKIGRISTTGSIIEYSVPTSDSNPLEITAGPDGNLWFTEGSGNNIGRITTTGAIVEYPVPTPNSEPFGITMGPDGNLWFTEDNFNVNQLGRITTAGVITEYPAPTPSGFAGDVLGEVTSGPDGNLWFTETDGNNIGKVVLHSVALGVTKFFTDANLNPLPKDANGNPKVNVVLANGVVTSTNPGQVLAWVNVTNTSGSSLQSLKLNDTLPVDWMVSPAWMPPKGSVGAIHVFYANGTGLSSETEITRPFTITVSTGNPGRVQLAISNFTATTIGHPLMPGQSILLSVKLSYGLMRTSQLASSYPRNYTDTAAGVAWTQASFAGVESSGSGSAFFMADAKVVS